MQVDLTPPLVFTTDALVVGFNILTVSGVLKYMTVE